MPLSLGLSKKVKRIKKADVVVGILTKNVESTVIHVMNTVREGVLEHLSRYRCLVVVSDGFSTDRTLELAGLFDIHPVKKIVEEQMGEPGKGNGIRTVFEIAHMVEARAVGIVDGDLLSIKPDWIKELIQPVLYGRTDLVVPFYARDKFDGVITNNLAYPFTRGFYGADVRQPIGGEFGMSRKLLEILRKHPLFPPHFGIDILITTVAASEGLKIREAMLGLKLHESTTKYIDPESSLIPMFRQVVGTMFDLAAYYGRKVIKTDNDGEGEFDDYFGPAPVPVQVNRKKLVEHFMDRYSEFEPVYKKVFTQSILKKLRGVSDEKVSLDAETWSKCVWLLFKEYKENPDGTLIDALRVLWIARFVSYYDECREASPDRTEAVIRHQARTFRKTLKTLS